MRTICNIVEMEILKSFQLLASSYELIGYENQLVARSLQLEARDSERLYHISKNK